MNYNYTKTPEDFAAWIWGQNTICFPEYEYIIHFAEPRCMIKYKLEDSLTDFEDFFNGIAEIQWFDGKQYALKGKELEEFLTIAWNFLAIEERICEDEMEDDDDDY